MNSAKELYDRLVDFKNNADPNAAFLGYCTQTLGSVERFHFDFKEKHDRRDGKLSDDDKKNLAKAVSGFANSGGGVLIWGIKDKSITPKPISDIQTFVSALLELAPQLVDPVVNAIDGSWISSDSPDDKDGYGLIYIPESPLPPHRVTLQNEALKDHYFVRSGSSFVVASHSMLEDMFGRRPKPELVLVSRITHRGVADRKHQLRVILSLQNNGRGAAKSPYLSVKVHPPYGIDKYGLDGNYHYGLNEIMDSGDLPNRKYGSNSTMVINSGVCHDVTAVRVSVAADCTEADVSDLVADYGIAAEEIQLKTGKLLVPSSDLYRICQTQ